MSRFTWMAGLVLAGVTQSACSDSPSVPTPPPGPGDNGCALAARCTPATVVSNAGGTVLVEDEAGTIIAFAQFDAGWSPGGIARSVTVDCRENTFTPPNGPLNTALDQIPLFCTFSVDPALTPGQEFTTPQRVGICEIDTNIHGHAVLGKQSTGSPFELLPEISAADLLTGCDLPTYPGVADAGGLWSNATVRLADALSLIRPRPLYALRDGGVGGSVRSFSDINPVIPATISGSLTDASSGAIPAVTIALDDGATTETDSTGAYLFTGILDRNYTVTVDTSDPDFPSAESLVSNNVQVNVTGTGDFVADFQTTATPPTNLVQPLGAPIPGLAANEQMGRSAAMSDDGNRILVGAPNSSAGGSLSGQVRAFEWSGSAWNQLGQSIDGFETSLLLGDDKGIAMSGNGQRIALGTPRSGPGSFGSVIIYELTGGTWTQIGQEIVPVTTSQFGTAVSLSTDGNRIAVGGPLGGGRAEVYELVGSTWTQLGASLLGTSPERLGYDVSLSGDGTRLMASLQGATVGTTTGAGKLRVYDWDGSAWTQVGGDIDGRQGFGLNASMSRDGRRVVGYAAGSGDYAAVFELAGATWVQMGPDFVVPGAFNVHQNVDLSASGDRVVLGASSSGPGNEGRVGVYDWNGASWTQVGMDLFGDHQSSHFGWSVAINADGSRFVAGMPAFNDGVPGSGVGGARAFSVN